MSYYKVKKGQIRFLASVSLSFSLFVCLCLVFDTTGADSIGHAGTCPQLLQMAGHGGTVSFNG